MEITAVEKSKKKNDMISIFVDNEFSFSVSEENFISLNLYEKKEITKSEIYYIKNTLNFRTAKAAAINFLSYKLRTDLEVVNKLKTLGFASETIDKVIDELKAIGYINNQLYTQKYVYDRSKLKPKSKRLLKMELLNKGVSAEIIDEVLSDWAIDECAIAEGLIHKKFGKYDLNDEAVYKKAYMFLKHRGYSDSTVKKAIKNLIKQMKDER